MTKFVNGKITQAQALSIALEILYGSTEYSAEDVKQTAEKLTAMREAIQNKRSTPSKADREKQEQNEAIREQIVTILTSENRLVTIKEMQSINSDLAEFSNQKMSAMLKALVDGGRVVKTIDKKITYFSMA